MTSLATSAATRASLTRAVDRDDDLVAGAASAESPIAGLAHRLGDLARRAGTDHSRRRGTKDMPEILGQGRNGTIRCLYAHARTLARTNSRRNLTGGWLALPRPSPTCRLLCSCMGSSGRNPGTFVFA